MLNDCFALCPKDGIGISIIAQRIKAESFMIQICLRKRIDELIKSISNFRFQIQVMCQLVMILY